MLNQVEIMFWEDNVPRQKVVKVEIMFWEDNEPKRKVIELDIPVDNTLELDLEPAEELIRNAINNTNWKYFDVDVLNYWID